MEARLAPESSELLFGSDKIATGPSDRISRESDPEATLASVANLLTLLRMLAAPVIIVLILRADNGVSAAALALFVAAALTDFLDGQVARRSGHVSEFGKRMDPLADRILISGTVLALAVAGVLPVFGVILVVARDFFLIIGYKVLQRRGVIIPVSLLGKSYTALFMVAITVAIAGFEPGGVRLGWWLFWVGVAGSLVTGAAYAAAGLRQWSASRETG